MNSVTIEHIESLIVDEQYSNTGKTTVCILKLNSGFEVVGTSGIVDASKFDEALGKQYAREVAINKIWELEGYRLQCEINLAKSDFDKMSEMATANEDISVSTNFVSAELARGGGHVTMGVDAGTIHKLALGSKTYKLALYIVNAEQFDACK